MRGYAIRPGLSPAELLELSPRPLGVTFSAESCETPGRVGSLQCTDVLRGHGLPALQAPKDNSCKWTASSTPCNRRLSEGSELRTRSFRTHFDLKVMST